jgi:hypothetical protein
MLRCQDLHSAYSEPLARLTNEISVQHFIAGAPLRDSSKERNRSWNVQPRLEKAVLHLGIYKCLQSESVQCRKGVCKKSKI